MKKQMMMKKKYDNTFLLPLEKNPLILFAVHKANKNNGRAREMQRKECTEINNGDGDKLKKWQRIVMFETIVFLSPSP